MNTALISAKLLPDGLSQVNRIDFLTGDERRLLSQVQGRTFTNMFGLVARFIAAKMLGISRDHGFGEHQRASLINTVLTAYRWHYIASGVQDQHFSKLLGEIIRRRSCSAYKRLWVR